MTNEKDNNHDELLSALIDDELSEQARVEFTALLARDSGAQARLNSFSKVDDLLRASLGEIHNTPLPPIDVEKIMSRRSISTRSVSAPMAIAASVIMLLGGVLAGIATERLTTRPAAVIIADTATNMSSPEPSTRLSNALESAVSGSEAFWTLANSSASASFVVNRTWKMQDGRYCREYEIKATELKQHEVGVACRESTGQWRIQMRTYPESNGTFL